MTTEEFTVRGKGRLLELQLFLQQHLPTASFQCPPVYHRETESYDVSLRYPLRQMLVLDRLHRKWRKEDQQRSRNRYRTDNRHPFVRFNFSTS